MCGICGAINFKRLGAEEKSVVRKITALLSHRGPDSEGFHDSDKLSLGHRRLSIIDLHENANQPMFIDDGKIGLVFNGEIYNFRFLRQILEKEYKFTTDHSDTEAVLFAYKKWGIKCLEHFNGMFAFCLVDYSLNKAYLVRDRIGEKHLYHTIKNGTIFFSSESVALMKGAGLRDGINQEAVYHYLTSLSQPVPGAFFKNISKLKAGCYLEIDEKGIEEHEYWSISTFLNDPMDVSYDEALSETEKLLNSAMETRNISDVPVTLALSGGLDSSLNLHYSSNINPDVNAINISSSSTTEFNEAEVAQRLCSDYGIELSKKQLSSDEFGNTIEEFLKISADVPTGDPNIVLLFLLAQMARKNGSKVLIVGEGGDEIGGYPYYHKAQRRQRIQKGIPNFFYAVLGGRLSGYDRNFDVTYNGNVIPQRMIWGLGERKKRQLFKISNDWSTYRVFDNLANEIQTGTRDEFLRKILNIEYKYRLPELILQRIDASTMATSIEARSPFTDHELIEYSARLPFELKMKNGPKTILKDIARKKLPQYMLQQPKIGFGMLLNPFFNQTLPQWFSKEIIEDVDAPIHEYLPQTHLVEELSRLRAAKSDGFYLWNLFALNKWLKLHL